VGAVYGWHTASRCPVIPVKVDVEFAHAKLLFGLCFHDRTQSIGDFNAPSLYANEQKIIVIAHALKHLAGKPFNGPLHFVFRNQLFFYPHYSSNPLIGPRYCEIKNIIVSARMTNHFPMMITVRDSLQSPPAHILTTHMDVTICQEIEPPIYTISGG
jgi:hypothetical protein